MLLDIILSFIDKSLLAGGGEYFLFIFFFGLFNLQLWHVVVQNQLRNPFNIVLVIVFVCAPYSRKRHISISKNNYRRN